MRSFSFKAADPAGNVHAGGLSAVSRGSALEEISRKGLIPIELREAGADGEPSRSVAEVFASWRSKRAASGGSRELLSLVQSLGALLGAGLTIDRALQISVSLAANETSRAWPDALLRAVRAGKTLAHAFEHSGRRLPAYFVSMIAAGEAGGSLPPTLRRLEELLRKQIEVRERVRGALVYPSLLAGMVIVTLVVLLAFVLPRFELLFSESRATLPWSTRAVLGVGRAVADYWVAAMAALGAAVAALAWWVRSPHGREAFDRWLLRTRLAFGIPGAINTGRLFRTVSTLCSNGQPLPAALRIARGTVANRYLAKALEAVIRDVQAGSTLSEALSRTGTFPAIAVQLTRVGEETGRLDEMLVSVAAVMEESSQLSLERLLTLLVPVLTVAMGLVVAGLIGSVLVGLLSINDLAF